MNFLIIREFSEKLVYFLSKKFAVSRQDGVLRYLSYIPITGTLFGCMIIGIFVQAGIQQASLDGGFSMDSEFFGMLFLLLLMLVPSAYSVVLYLKYKVVYDESGFTIYSPFQKPISEKWSDMSTFEVDTTNYQYVLSFRNGVDYKLSQLLYGHANFYKFVQSI